jgi:PAS domain S-box-containing protein
MDEPGRRGMERRSHEEAPRLESAERQARHALGERLRRHRSIREVARHDEVDTMLVQAAKDFAIFAMDRDGVVDSWNVGAERLTGYPPGEAVGRTFDFLWIPEDRARRRPTAELQQAAAVGLAEDENWILRRDGTRFWASGTTRSITDDRGELHGYVKVLRDMTRQREAEASLREAHERLKHFQGMVVHELRNPITLMLLQLPLLRRSPLDARQAKAVEVLDRTLWRMKRLCDDLADAARMQTGTFAVDPAPHDLGRLLQETLEALEPSAREADVALRLEAEPGLGVLADRHRIAQVVTNLVLNALRVTAPGGEVAVRAGREPEHAVVSVRDSGIGLTDQQIAQIFQPFSQVTASANAAGMGLGLFLSKAIVQGHGGRIWAESPGPGQGATFRFTVPLAEREPGAARA